MGAIVVHLLEENGTYALLTFLPGGGESSSESLSVILLDLRRFWLSIVVVRFGAIFF